MNRQLIQQQFEAWMVDFVEKSNPLLNGWAPCPYARRARVSGCVGVVFATRNTLAVTIESAVQQLIQHDIVAVCIDPVEISAHDLEQLVAEQNSTLMTQNVLLLEDHPDAQEILNGVVMNFGACAIVFVQQLSMINEASAQLRTSGYYDHWPKENLDAVVTWRVNTSNDLLPNQS